MPDSHLYGFDKLKLKHQPSRFKPVAVVDIGSNSVRMVVYDGLRRAPYPVFNEKILCGLGRGVATTGILRAEAIDSAHAALRRFRAIATQIGVNKIFAIATAAVREAENGMLFITQAREILDNSINILTGKQEARYAALGVIAGIPGADGVVGDLGGGSLELVDVKNGVIGNGVTLPLGPLRLIDVSGGNNKAAVKIITDALANDKVVKLMKGRDFYAVGGAWRNIGRLHMKQGKYPLEVLHHYSIKVSAAQAQANLLSGLSPEEVSNIKNVSSKRADTLPLAATVLENLLRIGQPQQVVMSVFGVREGLLYSKLPRHKQMSDPMLLACWDFARRYARSPNHELELIDWSTQIFADPLMDETPAKARLRQGACMLADIGWRTQVDYRSERVRNMIGQSAIVGLDHYERVFLSLTLYYRYEGIGSSGAPKQYENMLDDDMLELARQLSALFRLAFRLSAAISGMLPRIGLRLVSDNKLLLELPPELADLQGEVITKRLSQLAGTLGRESEVVVLDR